MSRKDIILISVLVNAGLLSVLLMTAVKNDADVVSPGVEMQPVSQQIALLEPSVSEQDPSSAPIDMPIDEVDHVLKEYLPDVSLEVATLPDELPKAPEEEPIQKSEVPSIKETVVEVTVKRGDALEKIARANQTTVEAIRKASGLSSDKLKIGQVLKVPVGTVKPKETKPKAPVESAPVAESDAVYYTVKSGDNPWKIAKQFQVKYEDLLKLNNLDEERAKNLKIGQKIRVK